jgi:DMSO/TMAO reductase YedYZ molybdopterin-dependent catalytic subunit
VTLHGTAIRYEGVALRDVLRAAGVARVDSLRGAALRQVVRLMGADDYTVVIALAELDPSLGALHAVIVDRENGAPLPAATGPFRLIVPRDGRASRAVRQLVRIDVIALP